MMVYFLHRRNPNVLVFTIIVLLFVLLIKENIEKAYNFGFYINSNKIWKYLFCPTQNNYYFC